MLRDANCCPVWLGQAAFRALGHQGHHLQGERGRQLRTSSPLTVTAPVSPRSPPAARAPCGEAGMRGVCEALTCVCVFPGRPAWAAFLLLQLLLVSTWKLALRFGQVNMPKTCKQTNYHVDESEKPTRDMCCLIYE